MTNRLLHAVVIPSDAQTETSSQRRKRLAKRGVLQSDVSSTETIAPQPGQQVLTGQVRGQFAPMHARMIEELFASSIETVPYSALANQSDADGYYALENISRGRLDAREDRIQTFDGTLTPKGTRRSHWRAVRTNPQTLDNPFGSATTPEIGLSIRARKTRWFDEVGGTIESATVQRTVEGEHDFLDIYDAGEPSFAKPTLIYDIPYNEEYPTDCTVWDTYDRSKVYRADDSDTTVGSATVGSSSVGSETVIASQWQRVYITDHEWRGDMVLETDRLRLVVDQPEDVLRAYRYDPAERQYNIVQLGASTWRLWDVNLTHVGLGRIEGQFEFEDSGDGSRHNLNATLIRGLDNVIWTVPSNEGTTPAGLTDRLDPIAATTDKVPQPAVDVIKRTEVDR